MFKPILTRILNHIILQNSWAKTELQPFGGKSVCFRIFPINATLTVLEDGGLAMAGDMPHTDATITIAPSVALRILADDEGALTQIKIEGDSELASALSKVLRNMSWDYEEDLSKVIGDAPAYQVAEFGRNFAADAKKQGINLAEMLAEYLQEERPALAKKRHVEQFIQDVDTLREDAERLEKRLQKLSSQSNTNTQENKQP